MMSNADLLPRSKVVFSDLSLNCTNLLLSTAESAKRAETLIFVNTGLVGLSFVET